MKLCLIFSAFLLVPLVFADLQNQVVTKYLFREEYVISQSFYDPKQVIYYYDSHLLIFHTQSNNTRNYDEFMSINDSYWRNKPGGFAIETYTYGKNEKPDSDFCYHDRIDRKLHPIRACNGRIVLRELTKEERKQLDDFINRRESSRLKVTYNRGQITTESVGFREFNVVQSKSSGGKINFVVSTDYISKYSRKMDVVGTLADKAFVIENLNGGRTDCKQSNVTGLEIQLCYGDIQIRPLTLDGK